MIVIIIIII